MRFLLILSMAVISFSTTGMSQTCTPATTKLFVGLNTEKAPGGNPVYKCYFSYGKKSDGSDVPHRGCKGSVPVPVMGSRGVTSTVMRPCYARIAPEGGNVAYDYVPPKGTPVPMGCTTIMSKDAKVWKFGTHDIACE